jgi:hypothetical protein
MMHFQRLAVPSVLFYVVESTCNPLTVTAEVASSSLVVPAILSKGVIGRDTENSNPVLRQNLIRVENGLIPRWNDLNMTRELNQKASPIG